MEQFYTAFFIRKSDNKLLRRFTTNKSKYMFKAAVEEQLSKLLDLHTDLEKRDIIIKEYDGTVDYER